MKNISLWRFICETCYKLLLGFVNKVIICGVTINLALTHWDRVTHICVSKLTIIASDNGLSPGRRQAIIWTSAGILLIGPLGTNFSEILIGIMTFSFKKMHLKVSSVKWQPCFLSLKVLTPWGLSKIVILETVSNTFSWKRICVFWLQFHWNLFLGFNLQLVSIGSSNGMVPSDDKPLH